VQRLKRYQNVKTKDTGQRGTPGGALDVGASGDFVRGRSDVHFGLFKIMNGKIILDAHLAQLILGKRSVETVVLPSQIARALEPDSLRAVVRWLHSAKWLAARRKEFRGGESLAMESSLVTMDPSLVIVLNTELMDSGGYRMANSQRKLANTSGLPQIRIRLQISSVRPSRPASRSGDSGGRILRTHAHVYFEGAWLIEPSEGVNPSRDPFNRMSAMNGMTRASARSSQILPGVDKIAGETDSGPQSPKNQAQSRGEFLRRMSHELRTPLHAISGVAQILTDEQDKMHSQDTGRTSPTRVRMLLEQLFQSSGQMEELIEQLLDFCYTRAASIAPVMERFDLCEVLFQSWQHFFQRSEEKRVSFVYESNLKEGTFVLGDWRLLTQLVQHQLSNAVKFTERGQIVFEVKMEEPTEGYVQLSLWVKDTGVGIQSGELSRLFNAFEQADGGDTRSFGGAGLGLFLCEQIAVALGSHLVLKSVPGFSTSFCSVLKFKLAIESARAGASVSPSQGLEILNATRVQASSASVVLSQREGRSAQRHRSDSQDDVIRILAVDDNEFNLHLMRAFLKDYNCTVAFALDGAEALSEFSSMAFDVVFMDLQMPNMDGYEATRQIRRIERAHGRPRALVAAVSASCFSEDVEKARQAGCDDHIPKPLRRNDIIEALAKHGLKLQKQQSASMPFPAEVQK
jgi:signal transduction histidine kinase/ActR/RegA family two-component response regulator